MENEKYRFNAVRNSIYSNKMLFEDAFRNLPYMPKLQIAASVASELIAKAFPKTYDATGIIIEPKSYHSDDWYLWTVAAYNLRNYTWSAWTMNLSTMSLNDGHYGVKTEDLNACVCGKKFTK